MLNCKLILIECDQSTSQGAVSVKCACFQAKGQPDAVIENTYTVFVGMSTEYAIKNRFYEI